MWSKIPSLSQPQSQLRQGNEKSRVFPSGHIKPLLKIYLSMNDTRIQNNVLSTIVFIWLQDKRTVSDLSPTLYSVLAIFATYRNGQYCVGLVRISYMTCHVRVPPNLCAFSSQKYRPRGEKWKSIKCFPNSVSMIQSMQPVLCYIPSCCVHTCEN